MRENLDFKDLKKRTITSFILIFVFSIVVLFYDAYIKVLVYLIYIVIFFELIIFFRKNIYIFIISLIYLLISFLCFNSYLNNYYLKDEFIYAIMLVIVFDIIYYTLGVKFGQLKILPIVSPNKTYFGFFSGFSITFIFGTIFNFYYNFFEIDLMIYFIFFTIISAFIGDIIESLFKRKSNLKNSSELLPGHGGFFDRFDSFLFTFITINIFYPFLFN